MPTQDNKSFNKNPAKESPSSSQTSQKSFGNKTESASDMRRGNEQQRPMQGSKGSQSVRNDRDQKQQDDDQFDE